MSTYDETSPPDNEPPDGGYGWVCVASCFLLNFSTWGAVSSYGIYLTYYLDDDRFGSASALDFAFVGGCNFAFAMLAAPFVTVFARRFGIHLSMCIGLVLQTTGYVTAGFASHVWQLLLSQGLLVGLGVGLIYVPSIPVLSQWFKSRRSLANGISSAGSGVGGALFTWSTGSIITALGLRWALCITGIITFTLIGLATALVRDRNRQIRPSQLAIDTKLLLRRDVFLLLAWTFTSMLGYTALLFSLSDYATSIGLSRQQATNVIGFLNIGTAVGRPIIGIVSDRFSRLDVAGILTLCCGLLCFIFWIPTQSFALLVVFALLAGAVLGVFWMPDPTYAAKTLAITEGQDDADIRQRYRPFVISHEVTADWVSESELSTALKMSENDMRETNGERVKILVLYGSLRERSYSRLLAFECSRILFRLGADVRVYDPTGLPVKDDVQHQHPKVQELRELSKWSDGHVWVSPEQHGNLTAVFKNQIDWIPLSTGSVRPTQGRTLAIAQVSGGSQSFNTVNSLRMLGRWMRMFAIPNQSSIPMAYTQFTDALDLNDDLEAFVKGEGGSRLKPSGNRDRVVDVMEELFKYTVVMRQHFDLFGDRHSERKEKAAKRTREIEVTKIEEEAGREGNAKSMVTSNTTDIQVATGQEIRNLSRIPVVDDTAISTDAQFSADCGRMCLIC
ncbi:arsenate resistance ArsH, partial [Aureobasidium melanogenum]